MAEPRRAQPYGLRKFDMGAEFAPFKWPACANKVLKIIVFFPRSHIRLSALATLL
jgi:hypothetical protein